MAAIPNHRPVRTLRPGGFFLVLLLKVWQDTRQINPHSVLFTNKAKGSDEMKKFLKKHRGLFFGFIGTLATIWLFREPLANWDKENMARLAREQEAEKQQKIEAVLALAQTESAISIIMVELKYFDQDDQAVPRQIRELVTAYKNRYPTLKIRDYSFYSMDGNSSRRYMVIKIYH